MKSKSENNLPKNKRSTVHQAEFEISDLMEAIDLLPEHHRTVFNLYVLEKHSHQEISKELDITINTSKSHLNRARKKLQEILFNKAKNKEKNNYTKYLFLLFPFYFSIDRLYAQKLKDYTLAPFNAIPNGIITNSTPINKLSKSILLKKGIIIFTISSLLIGSTAFYFNSKNEAIKVYTPKEIQKTKPVIHLNLDSTIIEIDSSFNDYRKTEEIEKNEALEQESTSIKLTNPKKKVKVKKPVTIKVPVIIHKQIIIKDTIEE